MEYSLDQLINESQPLIEKLDRLDFIYLRVSTKDKGQRKEDQLPEILSTFNLNPKECVIITVEESAYQADKQKNRKLLLIKDVFKHFEEYDKTLYVWDLDRLYRDPDLQLEFFRFIDSNNGMVLSHRQTFLHQVKKAGVYGKTLYRFFIDFLAAQAKDESNKKGDRLKKSLTSKNGRTYTNKNNLYGRKLKTIQGKDIKNPKTLDKIENYVAKYILHHTYQETIEELANKNVKISVGYITKLKKKYGLN